VGGEPRFRKDLYEGTADYYDRFRPPYPAALIDDLRARVPLRGESRVLDLACGTGQIAFALAADVDEVWAVDQEAGAVAFGRRKAELLGVSNIHWVAAAAEDVALDGAFDLVAVGNAFHRFDRDAVAARLVPRLPGGGCVALVWGETPWRRDRPWQRTLHDTIERWRDRAGVRDRVPERWERAIEQDPHETVLRRAGLSYEGKVEFSVPLRWSVESLVGLVYSTSFLSRAALGHHADAFEADLRTQLLACRPDGLFEQDASFAYELARRLRV
jgi:SAM-dependent methyltransferase